MAESAAETASAEPPSLAQMPPWVRKAIIWWWGALVVVVVSYSVAQRLRSLLIQLLLALFLSFALEPLVDRLSRENMKRSTASLLSMTILLAFTVAFVAAMGSLIASQLNDLIENGPTYIQSSQEFLDGRFGVELDSDELVNQFQSGVFTDYASQVAGNLVGVGSRLMGILFQVLTVSLFTYYFTADGPKLRRGVCSLFPFDRQGEILRVWELAINKTGAYISSRFILAITSAAFHWLVFFSLGLPSSVALAIWVGLLSQFVPVIGTYLAGVLPALIALGVEPTKAVWVIGAILIYQQVENYILQPRITSQTLAMHPAVAFGAVLAGGSLLGATGAVLALPFAATVLGFVSAYIERHEVLEHSLMGASAETVVKETVVEKATAEETEPEK